MVKTDQKDARGIKQLLGMGWCAHDRRTETGVALPILIGDHRVHWDGIFWNHPAKPMI
jgi:hypothetical protein